MDETQFRQYANDHLSRLSELAQVRLLNKVQASRIERAELPVADLEAAVLRPATNPYIDGIRDDPLFVNSFRDRPHDFAWVDPAKVVALQADVTLPIESVPDDDADFVAFCLPHAWDIPVEISGPGPTGLYSFVSSSPHLAANPQPAVEVDHTGTKLNIHAPKHVNLTQVVQLAGRFYCRNGHNRIVASLRAGRKEVTALVVQGVMPQDLFLGLSPSFFNPSYVMGLARPPLVGDLLTGVGITLPIRERRFAFAVQISAIPLNLPI
jgi:hypothetical protein